MPQCLSRPAPVCRDASLSVPHLLYARGAGTHSRFKSAGVEICSTAVDQWLQELAFRREIQTFRLVGSTASLLAAFQKNGDRTRISLSSKNRQPWTPS